MEFNCIQVSFFSDTEIILQENITELRAFTFRIKLKQANKQNTHTHTHKIRYTKKIGKCEPIFKKTKVINGNSVQYHPDAKINRKLH